MSRIILLSFLFIIFISQHLSAQVSNEKMMFVVDSIAVINDPEEGDDILSADVADMRVVTNKDTLDRLGYGQFEGVTFVFTKEYRARPDSLKRIPSFKQMKKENGVWLFHGIPYNGHFIDYYYSGRRQGEGIFVNGKVNGFRSLYYQNGNKKVEKFYKDGLEDGLDKEYYENSSVSQKGEFKNGKEEGVWENYFPNGQVKLRGNYKDGQIFDTATKYYSTGKIKEKVFIKNGKVTDDPALLKINRLMGKSDESNKEGDIKSAIKYCSKVIELDSTYPGAYFSRGTLKLNDFQFDDAINDLDKAIQYEPYMEIALSNRAFARIRKYQFANSRTLSKNKEVTILASNNKVPIPDNELEKICNDLQQAVFLGNKSKMITEALTNYCQVKKDTNR